MPDRLRSSELLQYLIRDGYNISQSQIYKLERIGILKPPRIHMKFRYYGEVEIDTIKAFIVLRAAGMSIKKCQDHAELLARDIHAFNKIEAAYKKFVKLVGLYTW